MFASAFVIAFAAVFIGLSEYNRGHEEMADLKAEITQSTQEIIAAYQADPAQANESYLGKIIQLTGTVSSSKKLDEGAVSVTLSEGANCVFPAGVQLTDGQAVTIKGECTGFMEEEMLDLLEVNLRRCVLVK